MPRQSSATAVRHRCRSTDRDIRHLRERRHDRSQRSSDRHRHRQRRRRRVRTACARATPASRQHPASLVRSNGVPFHAPRRVSIRSRRRRRSNRPRRGGPHPNIACRRRPHRRRRILRRAAFPTADSAAQYRGTNAAAATCMNRRAPTVSNQIEARRARRRCLHLVRSRGPSRTSRPIVAASAATPRRNVRGPVAWIGRPPRRPDRRPRCQHRRRHHRREGPRAHVRPTAEDRARAVAANPAAARCREAEGGTKKP